MESEKKDRQEESKTVTLETQEYEEVSGNPVFRIPGGRLVKTSKAWRLYLKQNS